MPTLHRTNQSFSVEWKLGERLLGAWFFCGERRGELNFSNGLEDSRIHDVVWLKRSALYWLKVRVLTVSGRLISRRYLILNKVRVDGSGVPGTTEAGAIPRRGPLPSPVRNTVPAPVILRPHGSRRVAVLTNQLLDHEDRRPRYGGGERYALEIARLLSEHGCEVRFFQPAKLSFESEYHGFPVTAFRGTGDRVGEFSHGDCSLFTELTKEYDHVLHNLPEYGSGRMREDALLICHGIWFDHDNYPGAAFRTTAWFEHLARVFANPRRIVSVDTNSVNFVRSCWPALARKMRYVCNFVDTERFRPRPEMRNPDRLTVLFPRRSQVNRGSRILGEILAKIPHDVDFRWVGEGEAEDTALIKKLAESDRRLVYDSASFDEMPEWYAKADIVVIPTIACEGTSLSCIEALSSGCATISTNVGGLTDLVFPGINGLLVDPDPAAIAEAVNRLIEDPGLRSGLQSRARTYIAPFSRTRWRSEWMEIFRDSGWLPSPAPVD